MEDSKNQFSILDVLIKWRKTFYKVVGLGTTIAIIGVLFISNEYIAYTTIKGGGGGNNFDVGKLLQSSGALSSIGSIADIAMPSSGGQIDYLVALLNSKSIQDSMISHFGLKEYYETKKIEDTREALQTNTVVKKNNQAEVLTFGVYHKNPEIAAKMSDYYADLLNMLYTRVNEQTARYNRQHLEMRYAETIRDLSRHEDSLKAFQQKYGVYDIYTQTSEAIKAIADLKTRILIKEVEIKLKKEMYGVKSVEIQLLESEIQSLQAKADKFFNRSNSVSRSEIFLPFKDTPDLSLKYIRLYRNVTIYNELIKVLIPMLEQTRLQEKRETPSLVIIDKATVPEKKAKPKRSLYVLATAFSLFVLVSVYVLLHEHNEQLKKFDRERYDRIAKFYDTITGDVFSIFQSYKRQQ